MRAPGRGSRAGGAGPTGGTRFAYGEAGEDIDLDDLFGGLFGGRSARGRGPVPGADQTAEIELTVADAYHGGQRSVTIGSGSSQRRLDVTIPRGVIEGQRIRLAGQGGRGSDGARPGDLFLVVRIRPDRTFRLEGRDIHVQLRLAPWEAALGTSVAVATPEGEAKVTVPAGTSSGKRLRLRGRGMPNPRGQPGDLYADTLIMVPHRPTEAERELFQQLAATSDFNPRRRH